MKKIKFIEDKVNLLNVITKGKDGIQLLQKKLLSQIDKQLKITFNNNDFERICRYIKDCGAGGAQIQYLNIFGSYLPCL